MQISDRNTLMQKGSNNYHCLVFFRKVIIYEFHPVYYIDIFLDIVYDAGCRLKTTKQHFGRFTLKFCRHFKEQTKISWEYIIATYKLRRKHTNNNLVVYIITKYSAKMH